MRGGGNMTRGMTRIPNPQKSLPISRYLSHDLAKVHIIFDYPKEKQRKNYAYVKTYKKSRYP